MPTDPHNRWGPSSAVSHGPRGGQRVAACGQAAEARATAKVALEVKLETMIQVSAKAEQDLSAFCSATRAKGKEEGNEASERCIKMCWGMGGGWVEWEAMFGIWRYF